MNRILYEPEERAGDRVVLTGERAAHVGRVLKSEPGDALKTGQIEGPVSEASVVQVSEGRVELEVRDGETPPRPPRDLILALPRPKVLNRLLPQIAALGVDRLILINASRVERYYFDSHVLEPRRLRAGLVEGLTQCGDTRLPEVRVVKRLRHFLEDDLEVLCGDADRWVLHPGSNISIQEAPWSRGRRVLAIGPEGGWRESELAGFEERGFIRVSMMDRILRSDTATIAALSCVVMKPARRGEVG